MSELQTDVDTSGNPFTNKAEVEDRPLAFYGINSAIHQYKGFVPAIDKETNKSTEGSNPLWLRKKLLTDDEFLNDTVSNMFRDAYSEESDLYYRDNPEEYEKHFNQIKGEVYSRLSSEVMSGEDVQTAIKRRQAQLTDIGEARLAPDKIKATIQSNTDLFEEFGILVDGELQLNSEGIEQMYNNSPEFKEALLSQHFEMFMDDMSKAHNAGGIDMNNVDDMAQAYTIFREFGKEGLTHIVNYNQHYDPSKPQEEQSPRVKDAIRFVQSAKSNDRSVSDALQEFYGSEESELGKFTYEPSKESLEMSIDLPKDSNAFTNVLKYNENFKNDKDRLVNFVETYKKDIRPFSFKSVAYSLVDFVSGIGERVVSGATKTPFTTMGAYAETQEEGGIERLFYSFEDGEQSTTIGTIYHGVKNLFDMLSPDTTKDKNYFDAEAQLIADDLKHGTLTDYTRNLIYDIHEVATSGNASFGMGDLFNTAITNSRPIKNEDGTTSYVINLDTADTATNLAVRTLRLSEGNMVRQYGDTANTFVIDPAYRDRLEDSKKRNFLRSWNETQMPVIGASGKIEGSAPAPKGALGSAFDTFITLNSSSFNLVNGVADHFIQLVGDSIYKPALDMAIEYTRGTASEELVSRLRGAYEENVQSYLDRGSILKPESFLENTTYGAGHMAGYLWTTYAIGNSAMNNLAKVKAFRIAKDTKNAMSVNDALHFIRPSAFGKLAGYAEAAGRAAGNLKGVSRGAGLWARIEAGEIIRQPITPASMSLYQLGQISEDMGLSEDGGDITTSYMRSNRIGQIGADILANGALSVAFDNFFAATRFGFNKIGIKAFGKKGGNSWKIEKGEYKKLSGAEYNFADGYSPDMRRFWGEISKELDELPVGAIEETMDKFGSIRTLKGDEFGDGEIGNDNFVFYNAVRNPETIQDLAYLFKEDADEYIGNLFSDVRNTLGEYDGIFTGKQTPKDKLDARAKTIVDDAIDNIGHQLSDALMETGNTDLASKFVKALREIKSKEEYVSITNDKGELVYDMSLSEAQTAQAELPFSTIVDVGENVYRVMQTKSTFWTQRVADVMEKMILLPSKQRQLQNFLKSSGVDFESTNPAQITKAQELTEEFNTFYGKGVSEKGEEGVIVDVFQDEVLVNFPSGDRLVRKEGIKNFLDMTEEQIEAAKEATRQAKVAEEKRKYGELFRQSFGDIYKETLEKTKQYKRMQEDIALKKEKEAYLSKLRNEDKTFSKYGVTKKFVNILAKASDYKKKGASTIRKFVSLVGHNGTIDYKAFGVNKKGVEALDMKKVKKSGGLNKNVVFSRNINGKEEHFITIRKTPEDFNPNLWYINEDTGSLVMNPYIRRIDQNQSFVGETPTLYKAVEITLDGEKVRMYRPVVEGEEGVLINVQKPMQDKNDITVETIFDNGIDALEYNLGNGKTYYRLIDETNQAVDPKKIKGHRFTDTSQIETKSAIPLSEEQLNDLVAQISSNTEVAKELMKANVFTGSIGGLVAGSIIDSYSEDDSSNWTLKLALLGGALQIAPKIFTKNKSIGGKFRKGASDLWEQKMKGITEHERIKKKKDKLGSLGEGDYFSESQLDSNINLIDTLFEMAQKTKQGITEATLGSKHARSMFSKLEKLNSPRAKKLQQVLMTMSRTIGDIYSNPGVRFMNTIYEQRVKDYMKANGVNEKVARQNVTVPRDYTTQFETTIGPEKLKGVLNQLKGEQTWADEYVNRQFNASIVRIIESGMDFSEQLERGAREFENKGLTDIYNSARGAEYQEIDRLMLADPEVKAYVVAFRNAMNDVEDRYLGALNNIFDKLKDHPEYGIRALQGDEFADMAHEFVEAELTQKQFVQRIKDDKNLSDRVKQQKIDTFDNLRKKPVWDKVNDIAIKRRKYRSFRNEYVMQKESADAELRARKQFIKDQGLENETTEIQQSRFDEYKVLRYIEVNADKLKLNQVKELLDNDSNGELVTKKFKTREQADYEIERIAEQFRTADLGDEISRLRSETKIIEEVDVTTGKSTFIVELPNDLAYGLRRKGQTFGANQQILDRFFRDHIAKTKVPNSNYLDNARTAYIPYEFRELDLETIKNIYSRDAGRRIHNMENNLFNVDDLETHYLSTIGKEIRKKNPNIENEDVESILQEIKSIYGVANGMLGENVVDYKKLQRAGFWSNLARNLQFMRFGYGFGLYNLFEWVTIGSQLTGGFKNMGRTIRDTQFNPNSINNMEALLSNELIFKKQIQYARPEFNQIGIYDYGMQDLLAKSNYYSAKGANMVGNFSLMNTVLGVDMSNAGAARLLPIVGDSFLGSSMYASALVARATLGEVQHIAQAARLLRETQFAEGAPRIVKYKNKTYTPGDIERKLGLYGIDVKDQQKFIDGIENFNKIIKDLDDDPNFNQKMYQMKFGDQAKEFREHIEMMVDITRNAVEGYNGINKMFRPESWDSSVGRVLSMYSTYAFNVSLQTLQRRIKQPIDQWFDQFDGTRFSKVASAGEIAFKIKSGNTKSLLEKGLTKEAIEAFPVEAVDNVVRVFGSMGISIGGYMSLGILRDLLAITLSPITGSEKEFDDFDSWVGRNRELTLNPFAKEEDQVTIAQLIDEGFDLRNFAELAQYTLHQTGRMGTFGRYYDMLAPGAQYGGLAGLTPVTSEIQKGWSVANSAISDPINYFSETLPKDLKKNAVSYLPFVGSNLFSEARRDWRESLKEGGTITKPQATRAIQRGVNRSFSRSVNREL